MLNGNFKYNGSKQLLQHMNCAILHEKYRQDAHIPSLGREPVGGLATAVNAVTHGQCYARRTVCYLPSRRVSSPLDCTSVTKQYNYCFVTEAHECEQLAQGW